MTVLRRQRAGRLQLSSLDRLLSVWLYRIWPQVIDAMVLVKPATVVQWHRKGFRHYWRWRSRRPGQILFAVLGRLLTAVRGPRQLGGRGNLLDDKIVSVICRLSLIGRVAHASARRTHRRAAAARSGAQ